MSERKESYLSERKVSYLSERTKSCLSQRERKEDYLPERGIFLSKKKADYLSE